MSLLTAVGSFAQPTATGNQRITGLGFQPKLVFFWMGRPTADGAAANAIQGFGAATSSSNRAYSSGFDTDAVSTTAAAGCISAGACIGVASSTANVSATAATAEADFVSMDNSGFTINWTTVDATARIVNYLALGGTDVANVTVGTGQAGTTTGTKAYTGLGFQPTTVLLWAYASTGSTPPTSAASIQSHGPGFGFVSSFPKGTVYGTAALGATAKLATVSGNMAICSASAGLVAYPLVLSRVNAAFQAASGQATSNTHKYERTAQAMGAITSTSGAINREADLTSLDTGGFTLNWTTVTATAAFFVYAALQGPSIAVGTLTQPTSAGTQQITGLGFQPSALILTSDNATASTSIVAGARNSFGAVAPAPAPVYGTAALQASAALATVAGNMAILTARAGLLAVPLVYNRFTQWVGDTNGAAPSIAKSYLDRTAVIDMITEGAGSQTINASADLLSFDASGFSLNWTSADATAREVLYLAIGPGLAASLSASATLTATSVQTIVASASLAATASLTTTCAVAATAALSATASLSAPVAVAALTTMSAVASATAIYIPLIAGDVGTFGVAGAFATPTISFPIGTTTGDLLLVFWANLGTTGPTPPTGWSSLGTFSAGAGLCFTVFAAPWSATLTKTFTNSDTAGAWCVGGYRGMAGFIAIAATSSTTNDTALPTGTPNTDGIAQSFEALGYTWSSGATIASVASGTFLESSTFISTVLTVQLAFSTSPYPIPSNTTGPAFSHTLSAATASKIGVGVMLIPPAAGLAPLSATTSATPGTVTVSASAALSATSTLSPGIGRAAQLSASATLSVVGNASFSAALNATANLNATVFLIVVSLSANATMLAYGPTNFYFPSSDGPVGGWTTDQGSSTGLFSRVNELVPRDTDFDQSSVNPVLDATMLNFSPITPIVGNNALLHVRYSKDQIGDTDDLQIELLQNGSVLQTWVLNDVPVGWQQFDTLVTTPIADWSTLQVRFTARIMTVTTGAVATLTATPNIVATLPAQAALAATQISVRTTDALAAQATLSFVANVKTPGSSFVATTSMTLPVSIVRSNGALSAVTSISTAVLPYVIIEPLVIY